MKLLALDISTNTGWAIFEDNKLVKYGVITCKNSKINYKDFSEESMIAMLDSVVILASNIESLIFSNSIDEVVIEQTNKGKARYTQKLLEWLHYGSVVAICDKLKKYPKYIDSSQWRKLVSLNMSKEDRKHNAMIKKTKGRGKISKKHLAVRMVNELFNLGFKMKDNDVCDAILIGLAYIKGINNGISVI